MSERECLELIENRELRKRARNPAVAAEKTAAELIGDYRISALYLSLYSRGFYFRQKRDTAVRQRLSARA